MGLSSTCNWLKSVGVEIEVWFVGGKDLGTIPSTIPYIRSEVQLVPKAKSSKSIPCTEVLNDVNRSTYWFYILFLLVSSQAQYLRR